MPHFFILCSVTVELLVILQFSDLCECLSSWETEMVLFLSLWYLAQCDDWGSCFYMHLEEGQQFHKASNFYYFSVISLFKVSA